MKGNSKTIETEPYFGKYNKRAIDYVVGVIVEGEGKGTAFRKYTDGRVEKMPFNDLPPELQDLFNQYDRV